jgi:PAS domain S-box-containing protein
MSNNSGSLALAADPTNSQLIMVVDDDAVVRAGFVDMLEYAGFRTVSFGSAEEMLATDWVEQAACILLDARLPGISGVETLRRLGAAGNHVPVVMITGSGDVETAVHAMKAGACDFLVKPAGERETLAAIGRAIELKGGGVVFDALQVEAAQFTAQLTDRQKQILKLVVKGYRNKIIAADLGISQRTVEKHRADIMRKSGVKSLPELTRMVFVASLPPQAVPKISLAPALDQPSVGAAAPGAMDRDSFERFFENIPLAVVVSAMSLPERVIYANPAFETLSGQSRAEVEGHPWSDLSGASIGQTPPVAIGDAVTTSSELVGTFRIDRPDGVTALIDLFSSVILDDDDSPAFRLAALVDVSAREGDRLQEFESQIREKDTRLLEMQHRVKNNLQMITALVRVEARKSQGRLDSGLFDRLAGRINSIQLVYKLLSEAGPGDQVDLGVYLSEIASAIMHASAVEGIRLDMKVDSYPVSVNVALPTGMVVNEVLTNALKHAFVDRDAGTITLHSLSDARGRRVIIADDGVGLPPGASWPRHGKLGALIVHSLRQNAKADLVVDSKPGQGTRVTISF